MYSPRGSSTPGTKGMASIPKQPALSGVSHDNLRRFHALVVVPPHLRYISGPLLGPALLSGAANASGFPTEVLDLAAGRWNDYATARGMRLEVSGKIRGDHDRALEANQPWCSHEEGLLEALLGPPPPMVNIHTRPSMVLPYAFDRIHQAANTLLGSADGQWLRQQVLRHAQPVVVGVSVLYAGQIVWAHAVTRVVRELWPGTMVVWGGPHVTALADCIAKDNRYAAAADGFVAGHAEVTWVEILRTVASGRPLPEAVGKAGQGSWPRAHAAPLTSPAFANLADYGPRLTLPVQTTIGCAYARCGFCTYPAVEGSVRDLDLAVLDPVIALARAHGAVIAVKDSLVLPDRLLTIADRIGGEVEWSACTKANSRLNKDLLQRLHDGGCRTLELGVETLLPASQRLIHKIQDADLLFRILDAASGTGIALVLNYITGFPGEDPSAAEGAKRRLESALKTRRPALTSKLEHHTFELDRLAPLSGPQRPEGLRVVGSWPWSSVLDWSMSTVAPTAVEEVALGVQS